MKTLLVLDHEPDLAAAIRSLLAPEKYRVLHRTDLAAAEPFLEAADFCVLKVELTSIQPIRLVQQLLERIPQCPVILYATARQWEWEEEAYLVGVAHVLDEPVRGRLLNELLDRLQARNAGPAASREAPGLNPELQVARPAPAPQPPRDLETLRRFASLLGHSLTTTDLVQRFLLLLREALGINRIAVFLRKQPDWAAASAEGNLATNLQPVCGLGMDRAWLNQFELSLRSGIAAHVCRHGRVLLATSEVARREPEVRKEFELLGVELAVPIVDRESFVGVAVLDQRLTGESFTDVEMSLLFQLLEELGLAVRNAWIHERLAVNHEVVADILGQLGSACVVVSADLRVLHANGLARKYFTPSTARPSEFEFAHLPQSLGSKVFQVLKSGVGIEPFKCRLPSTEGSVYQVTITPFRGHGSSATNAAMLLMEDFTQHERSYQLEMDAANLRLVNLMAERLAHEIGNSIVPLSTHLQLMPHKWTDVEFRQSLAVAMEESVKRISRLAKQSFLLARETFECSDVVPVKQLVEDAFRQAQSFYTGKSARLQFEDAAQPLLIPADADGLRHALFEVMLNALQADRINPQVKIAARRKEDPEGQRWIDIEVTDQGPGFSATAAKHALDPFYTEHAVGIGLGLTVARKVIEKHRGRIEIEPYGKERPSLVLISLPSQ